MPPIFKTWNATDLMRGEIAAHFDAKIPERNQLQLELLAKTAVRTAFPDKAPGRRALEFALADIADVSADHESEDMLGIDVLGMNASRKQRGETRRKTSDRRPERFRANWNSHCEGREGERKPAPLPNRTSP